MKKESVVMNEPRQIRFYNTMSRSVQDFKPNYKNCVKMYVCGVTPYDYCHIGHARAYVTFDVIRRTLEHFGYDVRYVQNFTNIDDKIIARAAEKGIMADALADKFIAEYFRDMDGLNVGRAMAYPIVTDHIKDIVDMIDRLINLGRAYEMAGNVYFDMSKSDGYGALSHRKFDEDKSRTRIDDPFKRYVFDFALWKVAKEGEPSWGSPWGKGRPGWHIECVAMSNHYLSSVGGWIDIHGGGSDLIFPHHENELAIARALGCDDNYEYGHNVFAKYWIHNGFVTTDKGGKFSKSEGNAILIRDVLKKYNSDVLRLFLLSTHYRMPIRFSYDMLDATQEGYNRIAKMLLRLDDIAGMGVKGGKDSGVFKEFDSIIKGYKKNFEDAMANDFDTPKAVAALFEMVSAANKFIAAVELGGASEDEVINGLKTVYGFLRDGREVLGLILDFSDVGVWDTEDADVLMQILIDVRTMARDKKDFEMADMIRDKLLESGFVLMDSKNGTMWDKNKKGV